MADPKPNTPSAGAMRVDTGIIRELADLLSDKGLTEIEVEDGDRKIKVRREAAPLIAASPAPVHFAPTAVAGPADAPAAEEIAGNAVKSPMVGTAFLSPEPGAKPFVSTGDTVKPGDTLLIIEAMKVMNPITATAGGVVKQIMVSDGQPVEFDQPLVVLG